MLHDQGATAMGISIKHNSDGTITVTCGSEKLRFFPDDDETTADGGGSLGIPVIDPPDNTPIGYPLPGAMGVVASKSPSGTRVPSVRVRFDHNTNTLVTGPHFRARLDAFLEETAAHPDARVPIAIETAIGESVDLESMRQHLPDLEDKVGRSIVPFLVAPPRIKLER
jgi:hypothetical protein